MSTGELSSWFRERPKWVQEAARSACSIAKLRETAGLKDRVHFLKTHLEPLLIAGWIERIISDKPRSSKQKYRLTENGRQALRKG